MAGFFSGAKRTVKKSKKPAATYTTDYPGIGLVRVVISRRASRITLTVKPDRTVRLTIPNGIDEKKGMDFLSLKKEWLVRTLAKYPEGRKDILPPYSTRRHSLVLEPVETASTDRIRVRIKEPHITVSHPAVLSPTAPSVQQAVRKGIEEAWRREAKEYLPARLLQISNITGLKYQSVTVRNTVSKWGSCSVRNDISLSLHLMRLPDHLVDYILIHELCHTVHKNHGPRFHTLLDKLTSGQHLHLRTELRNYHTRW